MSRVYIDKCPYCGKPFSQTSTERRRFFGKTEIICKNKKCARPFLDTKAYEWENLTNEEKKFVLSYHNKKGGIREGRIEIYTEKSLRSQMKWAIVYSVFLIGIPALICDIRLLNRLKKFKFDPKALESPAIQESIKRTSDQYYRDNLLNIGRKFYGPDYKE